MPICFFLHFCVAKAGGCSPSDGRFAGSMRSEGLHDAKRHGYDFFECGYGDVWVEGFTAKRTEVVEGEKIVLGGELVELPMTHMSVDGTLCCGIFKGCTVRWP